MEKYSYLYILASYKNGTLYIGATTNLIRRIWLHKNNFAKGFTKQYSVHRLVYYEQYEDLEFAFTRERQMKAWKRTWKIRLIEEMNPNWNDLYLSIL